MPQDIKPPASTYSLKLYSGKFVLAAKAVISFSIQENDGVRKFEERLQMLLPHAGKDPVSRLQRSMSVSALVPLLASFVSDMLTRLIRIPEHGHA